MGAEAISEVERRFDARNCAVGANFFHVKLNSLSKTPVATPNRHVTKLPVEISRNLPFRPTLNRSKWFRKYGVM
jgi:hypothetical protein